jgi:hypothetical protein
MQTIPWYQSRTLIGLLVAIFAQLAVTTGLTEILTTTTIEATVDKAMDIVAIAASAYAAWARARLPTPPVSDAAAEATTQKIRSQL